SPADAPRIEGFEILDWIGSGPRSVVWRARTRGGAEVGLKVLHPNLGHRPGFISLFERVTAALSALSHPNILGLVDRGVSDGHHYLVSEWMPRGSLRAALVNLM